MIRWTAHNCQFEDNGASLLHGACTKSGDPLFCILRGRGDFAEQLIAFDSFCSPCVVRLCNRLSGDQETEFTLGFEIDSERFNDAAAVNSAGQLVCAAGCSIYVFDVKTGQRMQHTQLQHEVSILSILSDDRVVIGTTEGALLILSLDTNVGPVALIGHTDTIHDIAILGDHRIASTSGDHNLRVWDLKTCKCLQIIPGVRGVCALNGGKRVATCGSDNVNDFSIYVWDLETGLCHAKLGGHTDRVYCLVGLEDGRLASGSEDETIRIWS